VKLPDLPKATAIAHVSPSLYEALLSCRAKALWYAHGRSGAAPQHPMALLGTCFHEVMEASAEGLLDRNDPRTDARSRFDQLATEAHERAHPLLRLKFPRPEKMPYYHLLRERAAVVASRSAPSGTAVGRSGHVVETTLTSRDGLVRGRPDKIDGASEEIFDFKTGYVAEGLEWVVSDKEARQLRLYAHLAAESAITVRRGTIVRGGGQTATIDLTMQEVADEASAARAELAGFNDAVARGAEFDDLAAPGPESCRFCACIPFCEAFWGRADLSWREDLGAHAEGVVASATSSSVQGAELVSFELDVSAGTTPRGSTWVEHVPSAWVEADGSAAAEHGDAVRVVDGRLTSEAPAVIRPDRVMTSVWVLGEPEAK
jgi:hypothetical protein